jgi:hypothetical protein
MICRVHLMWNILSIWTIHQWFQVPLKWWLGNSWNHHAEASCPRIKVDKILHCIKFSLYHSFIVNILFSVYINNAHNMLSDRIWFFSNPEGDLVCNNLNIKSCILLWWGLNMVCYHKSILHQWCNFIISWIDLGN